MTDTHPVLPLDFSRQPPPRVLHTDPEVPDEARPRLGGQNGKVLDRLRQGPATNLELEAVSGSRRINSRVADCRRYLRETEGKTITSTALDTRTGVYWYEITT